MKDLSSLMKQAQDMQNRMQEMQNKFENIQVKGVSGGGLVCVTLNAKGTMVDVEIDHSILSPDECEVVEDLIKAAHSDAKRKADEAQQKLIAEATQNLQLPPGMNLPFGFKT